MIRHPVTGALFVDETTEPGRTYHRAVGGGIEFGERAAQTLVRELDEEYGLRIVVGDRLGLVENLFTVGGVAGHEIVVVHEAWLADADAYHLDRIPCRDAPDIVGTWRPRAGSPYPLYPDGLEALASGR